MKRWAVSVALLGAAAAFAYILPAASILKHMAETRDALQLFVLRIDGSASFFGAGVKEAGPALGLPTDRPELQADATIYLKLPGRCRIELTSTEGGKQLAEAISNGKKRDEGPELSTVDAALQQACAFLAVRSSSEAEARATLERHLRNIGLKSETTSLDRLGDQITYVIGDPGPGQAQLWLYKDEFLPARVLFKDALGTSWDVKFLDYSSPATGDWFPRTLEVSKNGELQLRFTGLRSDARSAIPDKLF